MDDIFNKNQDAIEENQNGIIEDSQNELVDDILIDTEETPLIEDEYSSEIANNSNVQNDTIYNDIDFDDDYDEDDDEDSDDDFEYHSARFNPVNYKPIKPENVKNKGLQIFISILVLVLVASISASAGYLASDYKHTKSSTVTSNKVDVPKIELEGKPSSKQSNYTDVANKVNPSIVSIMVYNESTSEYGTASGVVYSSEGYIVTNDHIYDSIPNAKFLIRFSDGNEVKAKYIAGDVRSDLAVLKLEENVKNLVPATFGDSEQVVIGEEVLALGYSSSYGDSVTLTKGIISAPKRRVTGNSTNYASTFIQTDATLNPGNSGGALCNLYGQVVGITSSKLAGDEYDAVSYAIPTRTMKKVVSALIADGSVSYRAKLGITYSEVGTITAEVNNVPKGIYIGSISTDSGLYNKGFGEGDIITHVNGKEIVNGEVLLDIIDNFNAGDIIELKIYKTNKKVSSTVKVKLSQDKGSSSYSTKENNNSSSFGYDFGFGDNNDKSNNNSSDDNSSKTFDFPLD